ncbi:hypothetical protein X551_01263 [Methylibium sp. T29]|nr:hypothetical protein X551_01263 [Methylibium sp. T29]
MLTGPDRGLFLIHRRPDDEEAAPPGAGPRGRRRHGSQLSERDEAIDAKLASSPNLGEVDLAKVKALRSEGEAAHKAGKHDESMKALGDAKKILGI